MPVKGGKGAKKTASPKRGPAKKRASKKTQQSPAPVQPGEKNRTAIYLLVILCLITAIVLLLNKFDRPGNVRPVETRKNSPAYKEADKTADLTEKRTPDDNGTDKKTENKDRIAVRDIKVYFFKLNEKTEKVNLLPVNRRVEGTSPVDGAMKELIRGPSKKEKGSGILSAMPQDLRVRGIKISNRIAEIDFNGAIEKDGEGSILMNRLDQIVYTATQFDGIEGVVIKINGKRRNSIGSDGLSVNGPLKRRK
ncbi:MAG: GerMN domain-containing protein [Spirochaetes bacterium]|jgi:spore germination protein GerM|nr:GerMN domain-containing protein [Spirochaetota bacterium]